MVMVRRAHTVGQFQALRKNFTPAWNRLLKERPYYPGIIEGLIKTPTVKWFMENILGLALIDQWRERMKYGLVIGYATLGTQIVEEILTHAGAVDTVLTLSAFVIEGDDWRQTVDGQSIMLVNLLILLGEENTPTDPSIHAFMVLSKLSIDEEYREMLKFMIMDGLAERELVTFH